MTVNPPHGSGDRLHCVNQAARLRNVADELERDLQKSELIDPHVRAYVADRIALHRAGAQEFDAAIAVHDAKHRQVTPGEGESGVKP